MSRTLLTRQNSIETSMAKYSKEELINVILSTSSLDNDVKSEITRFLRKDKKYGLVWENSTEEAVEILKTNIPLLEEDASKYIHSEVTESPKHIIIEGDNLYALSSLAYTHEGKIDVIYIDPPYNTGAKDWRYNNEFVDDNDTYRHSKWVSWINRRIRIAKRLLSETGIIVATIDDYEIAQLRMLMDEVFGIENYLGTIVIRNNPSGRSTVRGLSVNHEYALLYSKSPLATLGHMRHNEEQKSRYSECDSNGYYEWENFRKNGTDSDRKDRPKQFYPIILNTNDLSLRIPEIIWDDTTRSYSINDDTQWNEIVIWPCTPDGSEKVWKYGLDRAKTILAEILVKKTKTGYELYRKKYLNTEGSLPRTWWDKPEYSARDNGTRTLTNIFGPNKVFDFPKAPEAVKDALIAANLQKDGIVLDFFAGSGTTLHATMMLNADDGGRRQCILVSNSENNICEEVTYERNKRLICGYTSSNGRLVEGYPSNELRYFRTIFKDRSNTHQNKRDIVHSSVDLLRIKENCFSEELFFGRLDLRGKENLIKYFADNGKKMLVIFDARVIPFVVNEIVKMPLGKDELSIYLFVDGAYPYTDDFKQVLNKVKLTALPYALNQALKYVLPSAEDANIDNTELSEEEKEHLISEAIETEKNEQ